MNEYPIAVRKSVLSDIDSGMSKAATARKHRVSVRWIYKLRMQRDKTGKIAPLVGKVGPKRKLAPYDAELLRIVGEEPNIPLRQLQARLGADVSLGTIWNALHLHDLTQWQRLVRELLEVLAERDRKAANARAESAR